MEKNIVGGIFFTRLIFNKKISAFILSPVAIATQCQKQGIGQGLIKYGIKHLKENNIELLFTYGDPNYYQKFGSKHVAEDLIKAPLKLTFPKGWLVQSLNSKPIKTISEKPSCVTALNEQRYW